MIRIYHARILTMQEDQEIFDGEIWISDHKIQYVGPENKEEAAKIAWERQIDAKGNLIMPGFKNAHTHSAMTFLRSHADDMPLLLYSPVRHTVFYDLRSKSLHQRSLDLPAWLKFLHGRFLSFDHLLFLQSLPHSTDAFCY